MKCAKKVLSVLLAVLVFTSTFAVAASAASAGEIPVGSTFEFGMYPQSLVTDHRLVLQLEASERSAKGDVIIGSNMYRGVKPDVPDVYKPHGESYYEHIMGNLFLEYEAYLNAYNYSMESTYWFKYEPITWRVLASDAKGVLLMAEDVLTARAFVETLDLEKTVDNSWDNSTIRGWLNNTFLNDAFSSSEQACIVETTQENKDNPISMQYNATGPNRYQPGIASCATKEKVYLPSFEDITNKAYGFNKDWTKVDDNGIFAGYYDTDAARQSYSTDYAKVFGVWSDLEDPDYYGICRYWLRTPGLNRYYAAGVLEDGRVSTQGWQVNHMILGIRPMIRVNQDAVLGNIRLSASDGVARYRQKDVKVESNLPVTWMSSNEKIATIDDEGNVEILNVGTVTFTATYEGPKGQETASCDLEVSYTWWQQFIRYFLFGWLWY